MNRPIVRVFGLVVVLFALLIGFTSRWTVFESASLRNNALNRRELLEQERIARGRILAERRHRARTQHAQPRRHLRTHLPLG